MAGSLMEVPLFPLPDAVFFPNTLLPLHVFEPRYKQLVTDALNGDSLVGIAHLRKGWADDYFDTPAVHKVIGIGRIAESERYDDGRYEIVLTGLYRGQILRESMRGTYRLAEVEVIPDRINSGDLESVRDVHEILFQIYRKLEAALPENTAFLAEGRKAEDLGPGALADVLSSVLVNDSYDRQSLLNESDVARRQQLLRVQIRSVFSIGNAGLDEGELPEDQSDISDDDFPTGEF